MKSPEEYRDYLESIIHVSNTTTTPSSEKGEATNEPVLQEEATGLDFTTPSRQQPWFQTHKQTITAVVVGLIIALIGWYGATLFRLNREVGIALTTSAALEKNNSSIAETLKNLEARLEREISALTSRIDHIVDTRVPESEK